MDFPPLDPASARARLANWKERTDKMAADTQALAAQVQAVRVSASDPDQIAEATVDHTGSLVDLVLSSRVRRIPEEESARAVLRAIQAAKAALAERSQEIVEATVGEDSPAGQAFMSGLARQFGQAPEQGGQH
ncbi:hypothetical protein L0U85_09530 [Glycomyces sp. L485]|uniref:hypothetical protein n=1 Tax=Glycomyces sp. L485 TaxID=2909235 RepID=UPI001F4AB472|nr:hypothetical protein [Glycomyces sp. L485]MCH7231091.1 hypothetical protein [Glycomyces sp. L485]